MKSATHVIAAVGIVPALWNIAPYVFPDQGVWLIVGLMLGAKCPDWLEGRIWIFEKRFSAIPHRSITHTWWIWFGLLWMSMDAALTPLTSFFSGVCISGLLHVLLDGLTPMGVPILSPFGNRGRIPLPLNVGNWSASIFFLLLGALTVLFA